VPLSYGENLIVVSVMHGPARGKRYIVFIKRLDRDAYLDTTFLGKVRQFWKEERNRLDLIERYEELLALSGLD